jgi:hypothetical protein
MKYVALCVGLFSLNSFASQGNNSIFIRNKTTRNITLHYTYSDETENYVKLEPNYRTVILVLIPSIITVAIGKKSLKIPVTTETEKYILIEPTTTIGVKTTTSQYDFENSFSDEESW